MPVTQMSILGTPATDIKRRVKTSRLATLTNTPPRKSYSEQMAGHFAGSAITSPPRRPRRGLAGQQHEVSPCDLTSESLESAIAGNHGGTGPTKTPRTSAPPSTPMGMTSADHFLSGSESLREAGSLSSSDMAGTSLTPEAMTDAPSSASADGKTGDVGFIDQRNLSESLPQMPEEGQPLLHSTRKLGALVRSSTVRKER
jgi:hypothetical protein